ncbi:MAG: cytochrome c3 family protein [Candidatus Methylomirabilia bacterium]
MIGALAVAPPPVRGQNPTVDLVVSYPPDLALVEKYDLPVEGYVRSAGVDEIEIVVNDERPRRVSVRARLFTEEVSLDDGLNTVRIGSVVRRVWLASASMKPPAGYMPVYGHFGLNDGCLECHETDDAGVFTLAGERDEICLWCHGDLTFGRRGVPWVSVHAPVSEGKCLGCHSPHTSVKKGLPADKPPGCGTCHAAVTDRLKTDRFVHGPMNLGDCRLCHTVHSSAEPKLLVRPATALCTDCHSDALPPAGTPAALQPHPMIPEGRCGRCHEPHSSANPRMLRQPAGRLCQECHEGKTRSFHEAKGFSIYICAKCHDLHRPSQPHLIMEASRSLCTQCHDFRAAAVFTHSFVAEGKCFLCHSFHEAPLSGDVASLCLGCHRDNPRLPEAHHGVAFERSRCTNCHLPHQARRGKLLRAEEHTPFKERACEPCHRDRAAKIGPIFGPLCTDCHRDKDAAAASAAVAVHPPFRDNDCSSCHRSHNSETTNMLTEPEGSLCLGCHRKMRKSILIAPVSAHSAIREGRCGDCHDSHYSANPTLLRKPQNELCPSCHAALVQAPGGGPWAVGHKPVAEGKCRLCHRSHTSTNAKLLKAPPPQSCRPCHGEFFAATEGAGTVSTHKPVRDGACGACHELHGGALALLLKDGARGATCRGCHPSPAGSHHLFSVADLQAKGGGSRAQSSGCLYCHLPHASAQRRLLLAAKDGVCQGCHKN